jgi:hypothetical protein
MYVCMYVYTLRCDYVAKLRWVDKLGRNIYTNVHKRIVVLHARRIYIYTQGASARQAHTRLRYFGEVLRNSAVSLVSDAEWEHFVRFLVEEHRFLEREHTRRSDIKAKCSLIPHQERETPTRTRDSNAANGCFQGPFSMRKALDIPEDLENAAQVQILKKSKILKQSKILSIVT